MTAADDGTRWCRHEARACSTWNASLHAAPVAGAVASTVPKGFRPGPLITVIRYAALFHVEQQTGRVAMGSLHELHGSPAGDDRPATMGRATSSLPPNRRLTRYAGLAFARIESSAVVWVGSERRPGLG
jgi:hypothetical protein